MTSSTRSSVISRAAICTSTIRRRKTVKRSGSSTGKAGGF